MPTPSFWINRNVFIEYLVVPHPSNDFSRLLWVARALMEFNVELVESPNCLEIFENVIKFMVL